MSGSMTVRGDVEEVYVQVMVRDKYGLHNAHIVKLHGNLPDLTADGQREFSYTLTSEIQEEEYGYWSSESVRLAPEEEDPLAPFKIGDRVYHVRDQRNEGEVVEVNPAEVWVLWIGTKQPVRHDLENIVKKEV